MLVCLAPVVSQGEALLSATHTTHRRHNYHSNTLFYLSVNLASLVPTLHSAGVNELQKNGASASAKSKGLRSPASNTHTHFNPTHHPPTHTHTHTRVLFLPPAACYQPANQSR